MFNNFHKSLNSSVRWLVMHGALWLPWYHDGNAGISGVNRDDQLITAIQVQAAGVCGAPFTHVGFG